MDHQLGSHARYFSKTFVEDPWAPLLAQLGLPNPGIGFQVKEEEWAGTPSGQPSEAGPHGGEEATLHQEPEEEVSYEPSDEE